MQPTHLALELHAPASPAYRRILLVEDDPELLPIIRHGARSLPGKAEIDWAPGIADGLHRLWAHPYDLVLVDYLLAETTTGLVLARWCARHTSSRIALMSAFPVAPELARAGLGTCPFLPKPFSLRRLRGFLRALLEPGAPAGPPHPGFRAWRGSSARG